MKILHVTPYYAPAYAYGGVVSAVTGLASAQAALGHSVTVFTTDSLSPTTRSRTYDEMVDGVAVRRFANQFGWLRRINLSSPIGMGNATEQIQAEIVHCHELRTVENLIMTGQARVPMLGSPHGTLPQTTGRSSFKRLWDRAFGQRLAARFRAVSALVEAEADDARRLWAAWGAPEPLLEIIPNGVSVPPAWRFTQRPYDVPQDGLFTVIYMGRLHERKGLHFLIPAFAQAAPPNTRLVMMGPDEGMLDKLRGLSAQYGITDRVVFTGLLTGNPRDELLRSADLFALPAEGEGLSMAALEAMAVGLPVLLTPGCNLPEAQTRGAGLVVARDIDALAEALRTLLSDATLRTRMGVAARAWMVSDYGWSAVAAKTVKFYEGILHRQQR